jgi:hypothetical protein
LKDPFTHSPQIDDVEYDRFELAAAAAAAAEMVVMMTSIMNE